MKKIRNIGVGFWIFLCVFVNTVEAKNVLVAYASFAGSTVEIAQFIGNSLTKKGLQVDVLPIKEVSSISKYQAIILGSAIRYDSLHSDMKYFLKENHSKLKEIPVGVFVVCLNTGRGKNYVAQYLDQFMIVKRGVFKGKLDLSKLNFFERLLIHLFGDKEGDYRDWKAIDTWTQEFISNKNFGLLL